MPKGYKLSPEQVATIPQLYKDGKTTMEIAAQFGIGTSSLLYHANKVGIHPRHDGKWHPELPKPQLPAAHAIVRHRPILTERAHAAEHSKKPQPKFLSKLILLVREGKTPGEVAEKLAISTAMVYYWRSKIGKAQAPKSAGRPAQADLSAKILALQQQGYSVGEIAANTGFSKSKISYHLYQARRHSQEGTNGTSSLFNKSVRLGIAYAETTRYIGVLGERLGLTPEILGRQLSELLGHSPLRSQRRTDD